MASNHVQSFPPKDPSTGSSGQIEHLYTNHFTCSLSDNIPLYQYDVSIEEIGFKDNNWHEVKGRARCASIMQLFISNNQLDPNIFVWHDGQKCLYSTSHITPQIRLSKDSRNQLNIKSLANQWSTNDIHQYINGQTDNYPYDAVRIIETLLKKSIQNRIEVIKNKCYFTNKRSKILDNGFEKRQGFIQSLHLSSGLITLNIQTKSTIFYSNISLLDFIHKQIGSNRIPTKYECRKLNQILENCLIVTQQSNWKTAYEFDQFDHRRPGEIANQPGETLIGYYYDKYGITLTQLDYPCIQVYKQNNYSEPCHLPLELCRIKESQVCDKQIPQEQDDGKGIPTPEDRYYAIMDTLYECDYNSKSNLLCQVVGFNINDQKMMELDARILTPPEIVSGPNHPARINNGRILLDGELYRPVPISNLSITYFGIQSEVDENFPTQFTKNLVAVMKKYNIYKNHRLHFIKVDFENIDEHFRLMKQQNIQFIICIMNAQGEENLTKLKCNIKKCGTILHGIMTQCAILSEIPSDNLVKNYCENLVRKINFKNGGINTKVNLDIALKNRISEMDSIMFVGADVIHPTNVTRQHPSIAAMVASGNSSCSITAARVCKQYPKEGKCSIETIVGMTEMIEQLLDYNYQIHKRLPTKVIFYRDGVDDGQFRKVREQEIPAIREAFRRKYGTQHPLLTFIVVKKRHNTRFFTYKPNSNQHSPKFRKPPSETDNMSIGAVIDTNIVHPYQTNFYLNSHNAYQGVNHPSLYHVLLDEIGFTINELQLLTHSLCFADPRSSASEAIPSVVHQADIAALKARDLFYDDDQSLTTTSTSSQNSSSNSLNYEFLNVHPTLKNLPVLS